MMKEIKKVNKISFANVIAMFYGVIGFFIASLAFIFSLSSAVVEGEDGGFSLLGFALFNIGLSILLGFLVSIVTAIFGWILGFLVGLFYNMFALRLGGVKIELTDVVAWKEEMKINKKS